MNRLPAAEGPPTTGEVTRWPQDFPELSTVRLRLRAADPTQDAAALLALFTDPEVARYHNLPACTTRAEVRRVLEQVQQRFAARQTIRWVLQPIGHHEAIGTAGFIRINHEQRRGELTAELARPWWGQGFSSEAATAVVAYGFEVLRLHRIEGRVLPGNHASVRVLDKLGFREEGTLRDYLHINGRLTDLRWYSLLATDLPSASRSRSTPPHSHEATQP